MRDKIFLERYVKRIEVGAFQEERDQSQRLIFDIIAELHEQFDAENDEVDKIVSYDVLIEAVDTALKVRRFNLLENIAEHIFSKLKRHSKIKSVELTIRKPDRIDGDLGIRLKRELAEVRPPVERKSTHILAVVPAKLNELPENANVFMPIFDGEIPKNNYEARRTALAYDSLAWELAESLNVSMVTQKTEQDSLIARQIPFVLGLGDAPFSDNPQLQDFTLHVLAKWQAKRIDAVKLVCFPEVNKLDKNQEYEIEIDGK